MTVLSIMSDLTSFGAAGLMGTMWLWERRLSRMREQQLTDAHGRILRDEERLGKLTDVVEQNTVALTRVTETQRQVIQVVKDLLRELQHGKAH